MTTVAVLLLSSNMIGSCPVVHLLLWSGNPKAPSSLVNRRMRTRGPACPVECEDGGWPLPSTGWNTYLVSDESPGAAAIVERLQRGGGPPTRSM